VPLEGVYVAVTTLPELGTSLAWGKALILQYLWMYPYDQNVL